METSGSYSKPDPSWALPGHACPYQGGDRVDKEVVKQVHRRLLARVNLLPGGQRRVSDEYVSRGGENSEAEEQEREVVRQLGVINAIRFGI
jgi:hypothetical protein